MSLGDVKTSSRVSMTSWRHDVVGRRQRIVSNLHICKVGVIGWLHKMTSKRHCVTSGNFPGANFPRTNFSRWGKFSGGKFSRANFPGWTFQGGGGRRIFLGPHGLHPLLTLSLLHGPPFPLKGLQDSPEGPPHIYIHWMVPSGLCF